MNTKIFLGMSLAMGLAFTACNDDDVTINTTPIISENSVVTGSADVTATSATFHATIDGLSQQAAASYATGFKYGYAPDALSLEVPGDFADGVLSASVEGLPEGTVIYYQAFVTLSGKVTLTGEVKQLVTTDAVVTTADATGLNYAGATLAASTSGATPATTYGFVISANDNEEAVRGGLVIPTGDNASASIDYAGLAPATTYYYAGYADLGSGIIYGEVKSFTTPKYDFDADNDLVDLGLSVKWGKTNIGANDASLAGGLFGYGDVAGVNNSINPADYATGDIARTDLDMAGHAWDGSVTIPTAEQWEELFNSCKSEWTTQNGVEGFLMTASNGNSIFLPAAGSRTMNSTTGAGINGIYATGTGNGEKYNIAFQFNKGAHSRTSTPVYEALSVRPVSTAIKTPFVKENLYKTWAIDFNDEPKEGMSPVVSWSGPVWYYGKNACWRSVSNNEPVVDGSLSWDPDYTGNGGWGYSNCRGEMTLNEDGTVKVTYPDGTSAEGTYTLDEKEMTITSTINLLAPGNFNDDMTPNRKEKLPILSLTEKTMQLGYYRPGDPAILSVNMIPAQEKGGFTVVLGIGDQCWASGSINIPGGNGSLGTWTVALDPSSIYAPSTSLGVWYLDVQGYKKQYPESFVRIDKIVADGKEIKYDASKFHYGDIEGNGNYRVEIFNQWGSGTQNDSPFVEGGGYQSQAPVAVSESLEVTFTIVSNTSNGAGNYPVTMVTVSPDWSVQTWDASNGDNIEVIYKDFMYSLGNNKGSVKFENSCPNGVIMNYFQINNLYQFFPGIHGVLTNLAIDGVAQSGWDNSKILDQSADGGGVHYRLELYNCWGATSGNSAFGPKEGDANLGLGFKSSIEQSLEIKSLYAYPW